MTTLGNKVKKLRELRNYTQEYIAEQLGVSRVAYSKMERDETAISQERLEQIAKVLDISVSDILAFDEKEVFNFINSKNSQGKVFNSYNNYYASGREAKLQDDKIKLLEEKVDLLKSEIEKLREENERLRQGGRERQSGE